MHHIMLYLYAGSRSFDDRWSESQEVNESCQGGSTIDGNTWVSRCEYDFESEIEHEA
jgi:hypothetical protein